MPSVIYDNSLGTRENRQRMILPFLTYGSTITDHLIVVEGECRSIFCGYLATPETFIDVGHRHLLATQAKNKAFAPGGLVVYTEF